MKESNAPVIGRTPFQKWLDKYQGILYLIPWIIGFVVFKAFPFGQSPCVHRTPREARCRL